MKSYTVPVFLVVEAESTTDAQELVLNALERALDGVETIIASYIGGKDEIKENEG